MRTEAAYNIKNVDGIRVIDWAPAETALSRGEYVKGKIITFDNAEKLTLEDGRTMFGCTFDGCTFTHPSNPLMVASNHWVAEHEPRVPREFGQYLDWSLRDILDTVAKASAAVERLMERTTQLESERLSQGNKTTMARLATENTVLKEEIARLAEVKQALTLLQQLGGQ